MSMLSANAAVPASAMQTVSSNMALILIGVPSALLGDHKAKQAAPVPLQ